jgi:curved DNA-binding protein CbpA
MPIKSPYQTLGVPPSATDAQVRAAYRRLVQLHHPDHNSGSPESARRFEEVQEAYAQVLRERKKSPPPRAQSAPPPRAQTRSDPDVETRLKDLERQVRAAQERARKAARQAARKAAREAARQSPGGKRPTDEELGYYTTDDSFTSILADARQELSQQLAHAQEHPVAKRVADLIEGLEQLASKLDRH